MFARYPQLICREPTTFSRDLRNEFQGVPTRCLGGLHSVFQGVHATCCASSFDMFQSFQGLTANSRDNLIGLCGSRSEVREDIHGKSLRIWNAVKHSRYGDARNPQQILISEGESKLIYVQSKQLKARTIVNV